MARGPTRTASAAVSCSASNAVSPATSTTGCAGAIRGAHTITAARSDRLTHPLGRRRPPAQEKFLRSGRRQSEGLEVLMRTLLAGILSILVGACTIYFGDPDDDGGWPDAAGPFPPDADGTPWIDAAEDPPPWPDAEEPGLPDAADCHPDAGILTPPDAGP